MRTSPCLGGQIRMDIPLHSHYEEGKHILRTDGLHIVPLDDRISYVDPGDALQHTHLQNINKLYKAIGNQMWNCSGEYNSPYPLFELNGLLDPYSHTYIMGSRRTKFGKYKKQFSFLCPLWISEETDASKLFFDIYLCVAGEERSHVASARITLGDDISNYLNEYLHKSAFWIDADPSYKVPAGYQGVSDNLLSIKLNPSNACITGVNVENGQYLLKDVTYVVPDILCREMPLVEFDGTLLDLFPTNHMIAQQMLNLNFLFNIEDISYFTKSQLLGKGITVAVYAGYDDKHLTMKDLYTDYNHIPVYRSDTAEFDNVLHTCDYMGDDKMLEYMSINRFVQPIFHWTMRENPKYIYNFYDGFAPVFRDRTSGEFFRVSGRYYDQADIKEPVHDMYNCAAYWCHWNNMSYIRQDYLWEQLRMDTKDYKDFSEYSPIIVNKDARSCFLNNNKFNLNKMDQSLLQRMIDITDKHEVRISNIMLPMMDNAGDESCWGVTKERYADYKDHKDNERIDYTYHLIGEDEEVAVGERYRRDEVPSGVPGGKCAQYTLDPEGTYKRLEVVLPENYQNVVSGNAVEKSYNMINEVIGNIKIPTDTIELLSLSTVTDDIIETQTWMGWAGISNKLTRVSKNEEINIHDARVRTSNLLAEKLRIEQLRSIVESQIQILQDKATEFTTQHAHYQDLLTTYTDDLMEVLGFPQGYNPDTVVYGEDQIDIPVAIPILHEGGEGEESTYEYKRGNWYGDLDTNYNGHEGYYAIWFEPENQSGSGTGHGPWTEPMFVTFTELIQYIKNAILYDNNNTGEDMSPALDAIIEERIMNSDKNTAIHQLECLNHWFEYNTMDDRYEILYDYVQSEFPLIYEVIDGVPSIRYKSLHEFVDEKVNDGLIWGTWDDWYLEEEHTVDISEPIVYAKLDIINQYIIELESYILYAQGIQDQIESLFGTLVEQLDAWEVDNKLRLGDPSTYINSSTDTLKVIVTDMTTADEEHNNNVVALSFIRPNMENSTLYQFSTWINDRTAEEGKGIDYILNQHLVNGDNESAYEIPEDKVMEYQTIIEFIAALYDCWVEPYRISFDKSVSTLPVDIIIADDRVKEVHAVKDDEYNNEILRYTGALTPMFIDVDSDVFVNYNYRYKQCNLMSIKEFEKYNEQLLSELVPEYPSIDYFAFEKDMDRSSAPAWYDEHGWSWEISWKNAGRMYELPEVYEATLQCDEPIPYTIASEEEKMWNLLYRYIATIMSQYSGLFDEDGDLHVWVKRKLKELYKIRYNFDYTSNTLQPGQTKLPIIYYIEFRLR